MLMSGCWRVCGKDTFGRPIVLVRCRLFRPDQINGIDEYIKFVFWFSDRMAERYDGDVEQSVYLFDFSGWGLANNDNSMTSKLISITQDHFPERLGLGLIINAPTVFKGVWSVIRPWLNERTRVKVHFLNNDYKEQLLTFIDADVLPEELGGRHAEYPVLDEVLKRHVDAVDIVDDEHLTSVDVARGKALTVDFVIPGAGKCVYGLSVASNDVGLSIDLLPTGGEASTVRAAGRVRNRIHGEFRADAAGICRFALDNTFSWTKGKTVRLALLHEGQVIDGHASA